MTHKKWEELGLLDGLHDNRKKDVAKAFTIIYEYVESNPSTDGQYETLAFPIIRRIVGNIDLTREEIIQVIKESREAFKIFVPPDNCFLMDVEPEFTNKFVNDYLERANPKK